MNTNSLLKPRQFQYRSWRPFGKGHVSEERWERTKEGGIIYVPAMVNKTGEVFIN